MYYTAITAKNNPCPLVAVQGSKNLPLNGKLFALLGGLLGRLLGSLFLAGAATNHLGRGDVALLVDEVQVAFLSLHADLGDFLGGTAFFGTAGHFRRGNVALLVDEIEITLLFFHA